MGERLIFTFALTGRREWGMVPRALPWATDLLGFQPAQGRRQGFFRTISTYLISLNFEHSTFRGRLRHRYKRRCANMRRSSGAKHCSSLCSQSEGVEYCGGQARAKNPSKSCPRALVMFAACSWPSLCEQSELQCWRRNRRLCGSAQISAARALPLTLISLDIERPIFQGRIITVYTRRRF